MYQQMASDLGMSSITEVKMPWDIKKETSQGKGNLVKKYLSRFDLILVDDRLSLKSVAKELGG